MCEDSGGELEEIVFVGEEALLMVIFGLVDVELGTRQYDSWSSWHGNSLHNLAIIARLK